MLASNYDVLYLVDNDKAKYNFKLDQKQKARENRVENREARKAMLDAYPNLRAMYDENDGNTQVLYFKNAKAVFSSFTSGNEEIEF